MARAGQVTNYFTFIGGKNTESSPLNSPPNTALEIVNFDLRRDGSLWRRKGLALETSGTGSSNYWSDSQLEDRAYNSYTWKNVGGTGTLSFIVIQVGTSLRFYSNESSVTSANYKGAVELSDHVVDGGKAPRTKVAFASGKGRLYVVSEYMEPVYIEWDSATASFTKTQFTIQIRDFEGIDDGVADSTRPDTLTSSHYYNLVNSGWPDKKVLCTANFGTVIARAEPIKFFKTWSNDKKYPAKTDLYYAMKDDNSPNPYGVGSFSPDVDGIVYNGNSVSPKGHFIIDAFSRDRQTPFGTGNARALPLPSDPIYRRPSCVSFFASRAWYAGVFDKDFNNKVYYSQILRDKENAGKCYQENDPTVEDLNKLLDTDGGVVTIAEAGAIFAIHPVADYLIAFANNGVWAIGGTDGGAFKPTAYSVKKISSAGALGRDCCNQAQNVALYMSDEGIFAITPDPTSGYPVAKNMTLDTIQTDYLAINEAARINSHLLIDSKEMIAYWFYDNTTSYDGSSYKSLWNKALVYNLPLQAFYDYTLAVDRDDVLTVVTAPPFITSGSSQTTADDPVYIDAVYPDIEATITVGPSGRDYTTLQAAYNAIVAGTHGTASTKYAVLVDAGTYSGLSTNGTTGRHVAWKSRDGAATTIISSSSNTTDLNGGYTSSWEGFTFTTSTGAIMLRHRANTSRGTVYYSKCIVNTDARLLTFTNTANSLATVKFYNCVCHTTDPQVDNHEASGDGDTIILELHFYNTSYDSTGGFSGTSGLSLSRTPEGSTETASVTDGEPLFFYTGSTVETNLNFVDFVYDSGSLVTVGIDSFATVPVKIQVPSFLGSNGKKLYFYDFKDTSFQDYGVSNTAWIKTGYETLGDAIRDKAANYVYCFFNRTETDYTTNESGCTLRMKWAWSNLDTSGRWTDQQAVYRLNARVVSTSPAPFFYPYDVVDTKTRFRGWGKTALFMFESVGDKDCQMLGWSVPWAGETQP